MLSSLKNFRSWLVIAFILLAPLSVLIYNMGDFAYPSPRAAYSDITVSHYPNAVFLRSAIFKQRTIPLWSPTILSGYPFIANPLSGIFYPPGWLAILLPLPFAFNLLALLHLLWGGIGMFILLRRVGVGQIAALMGAIGFEALPKIFAHFGAGHISLIFAITWTPWLLLASLAYFGLRGIEVVDKPFSRLFIQPGLIFGLILLADVRWAFYSGVLWWLYVLFQIYIYKKSSLIRRGLLRMISQTILGLFLAAPLLVPFAEYTLLSSRSQMNVDDVLAFSLPPSRLLGIFYPDFGGFHEWVSYPGTIITLLALVGSAMLKKNKEIVFWVCAVIATLLFSLGNYLPWMSLIAELPIFRLLRIPSRFLFLTGFGMIVIAAWGLQFLLDGLELREVRRIRLFLIGFATFIVSMALGVWTLTGEPTRAFLWGGLLTIVGTVWIVLGVNKRVDRLRWGIGFLILLAADLIIVNVTLFYMRPTNEVANESKILADYLAKEPKPYRLYSPSYSLPQHTAADHEIELAYGVDPLHLERYAAFMEQASGVPRGGYSVTVPSLIGEDPKTANIDFKPDPKMLSLLNVGYVVSAFELSVEGLRLEDMTDGTWIYENLEVRPRAWIQEDEQRPEILSNHVKVLSNQPNVIELEADGPGMLVISEVNYPGWQVRVDRASEPIQEVYGLLRGVILEPGRHQVRFYFVPESLYIGLGLWVVGVIFCYISSRTS